MFGVIVDKSHLKAGKFKPWVTISTFLIPIATILIFAMPETLSMPGKIAYAATTYIIFGMLYTVCDVPIFALATAMTNNIQERTTLISIGRVAATIAMVILSVSVMKLIGEKGEGRWLSAAVILSVTAFLVMLPVSVFARERFVDKNAPAVKLKDIMSYLLHNKFLLIFYLGNIIFNVTNTTMPMLPYVAKYFLGGEHMIMYQNLVYVIPMITVSVLLPLFTRKIDKFHIYIFGILIYLVASIAGYFAGYNNLVVYFTLAALRGIGIGITSIMMFMFAADCVEYGNYKTGTRAEGITFSIQTFANKINSAISGALAGIALSLVGYTSEIIKQIASGELKTLPETTMRGLWNIAMLFPIIGIIICLPVFWFYKLRDKDVQIMARCNQKEISREDAEKLLSRKY
jgi:sugar (glycoside-pentoside-hexuronide) transporter